MNETTIKSPGVYVNEISSFPPSIAQVATAIPAFIGYTQQALQNGKDVTMKAVRISSLVEYTNCFGGEYPNLKATATLNLDNSVATVDITPGYQLFNAIRLFFNHGGVNCYIISVGIYKTDGTVDIEDFIPITGSNCFDILKKEDEPTLIIIPDAVGLASQNDFNNLMTSSLQQCGDLQDRFTIMDIYDGFDDRSYDNDDVIDNFRNGVAGSNLNYGAAYYPWLRTSLQHTFSFSGITVNKPAGNLIKLSDIVTDNPYLTQLNNASSDLNTLILPFINTPTYIAPFNVSPYVIAGIGVDIRTAYGLIPLSSNKAEMTTRITYIKQLLNAFIALNTVFTDLPLSPAKGNSVKEKHDSYIIKGSGGIPSNIENFMRELILIDSSFPISPPIGAAVAGDFTGYSAAIAADATIYGSPAPTKVGDAVAYIRPRLEALYENVVTYIISFYKEVDNLLTSLDLQLTSSSVIYAGIKTAIKNAGIVVPPCGAIAGVYANVDATRGVWKAPANVALNTVIEPMVTIDDNMQSDLNIDVNAGKSINAIRAFTGKGILVWGARTLDGNSNDFRYISVRRFYIMVEESVKKATMQFVFEPNDANTWTKVRAMIENYLTNLWRQGALAGAKPEQAFYVKVGLGQTMIFDDILNGRMIVEIGMAPVRPAEFIILRFTQIQQTS
jgi:phage tail sheath protein FI